MNKEYTRINDTDYIVSSDKGEIDLVKVNSNIEEILMKENEIEETNSNLSHKKYLLNNIKSNDRLRKSLNEAFIVSGIICAIIGYFTQIGIETMLTIIVPCTCAFKLPTLVFTGTKKSNQREIKSLDSSIELELQNVEKLSKELEELKRKNNYQKLPCSETHINPMQQPTHEQSQNKVKRLVLDKEQ